jgi:hypothetical protein
MRFDRLNVNGGYGNAYIQIHLLNFHERFEAKQAENPHGYCAVCLLDNSLRIPVGWAKRSVPTASSAWARYALPTLRLLMIRNYEP